MDLRQPIIKVRAVLGPVREEGIITVSTDDTLFVLESSSLQDSLKEYAEKEVILWGVPKHYAETWRIYPTCFRSPDNYLFYNAADTCHYLKLPIDNMQVILRGWIVKDPLLCIATDSCVYLLNDFANKHKYVNTDAIVVGVLAGTSDSAICIKVQEIRHCN